MSQSESRILIFALFVAICLGQVPSVPGENANQEIPPMVSRGTPQIIRVTSSAMEIPLYGMWELTIDLRASYDNPFDPEQVDLTAEFTTPSGKKVTEHTLPSPPVFNGAAAAHGRLYLAEEDGSITCFGKP